jgi:predicted anti-sigma-YlaC factor YlaD
MSCKQSELWMMDALDGALVVPDRQRLAAHLEVCPRCRAEWEALNALEQMLTDPPMVLPAPGFAKRVEARLDRFEAQRRTLVGGLILLAAAMALCLLAVPSLLDGRNPIQAYGAFLRSAYELFGYGVLLSHKVLSALWLTLDALAKSVDVPLLNLLSYAAGAFLAAVAWRRALLRQPGTGQTMRNGH